MKKIGIILVAIGLILGYIAFSMDTTISAGLYGERVNNIGLMDERRNYLLVASLVIISGLILFGIGKMSELSATRSEAAKTPQSLKERELLQRLASAGCEVTSVSQNKWEITKKGGLLSTFAYSLDDLARLAVLFEKEPVAVSSTDNINKNNSINHQQHSEQLENSVSSVADRLKQLEKLRHQELISEEEFSKKRTEILESI
jgi:excinuclease UvrABC helicase subunit UvrB